MVGHTTLASIIEQYRLRPGTWERYLRSKYDKVERYKQMKGVIASTRVRTTHTFRVHPPHWMRRMANYIRYPYAVSPTCSRQRNGPTLAKSGEIIEPISARYGTPPLDMGLAQEPEDVIQEADPKILELFQEAWMDYFGNTGTPPKRTRIEATLPYVHAQPPHRLPPPSVHASTRQFTRKMAVPFQDQTAGTCENFKICLRKL